MIDVSLDVLKANLYARRASGIVVPFFEVSALGWQPQEHQCHNNSDRYCSENADYQSVRGWLLFDFRNLQLLGLQSFFRFTAHSVLRASDGSLVDITPSRASQRYPFLTHEGPPGEFEAIVEAGHIHLDLPI